MKALILLVGLFAQGVAFAQNDLSQRTDLSYNFLELRFVDVDTNGGDGLLFNGSYDLQNNWLIVGGITSIDYNNNVDVTWLELGAGYVWPVSDDFDLVSTLRFVRGDLDTPFGGRNDNGFALSSGVRGLLTPQFEIRGSVNHINLDNSDTYLELAGDYYITSQFSAGLSLEFAGDTDAISIGARWFFK